MFGSSLRSASVGNGRLRDECLNETLFASLRHARSVLRNWRDDCNHVRPHSAIGGLTPADAARRLVQPRPDGRHDNPGLYLWLEARWGASQGAQCKFIPS